MHSLYRIGHDLLDTTFQSINNEHVFEGMEKLLFGLHSLRTQCPSEIWTNLSSDLRSRHPLTGIVHQSPFTGRAYRKPRGYPGDAKTLDYIYGLVDLPTHLSSRTRNIYEWEFQTLSCRSVRERGNVITSYIDQVADSKRNANILSVGSGHLRESQQSHAVLNHKIAEYFALDHDQKSLSFIDSQYNNNTIKTIHAPVSSLLTKKVTFSRLDLVYAAGLYDYLSVPFACALTQELFNTLNSNGILLIANFAPNLPDSGYMETYMEWKLTYRNERELEQLTENIPFGEIGNIRTFRDSHKNMVYLEIIKK